MTGFISEGMGKCAHCGKPVKDGQPIATPKPPVIGIAHKGCVDKAYMTDTTPMQGEVYGADYQKAAPILNMGDTKTLHQKVAEENARIEAKYNPQPLPPMEPAPEPPAVQPEPIVVPENLMEEQKIVMELAGPPVHQFMAGTPQNYQEFCAQDIPDRPNPVPLGLQKKVVEIDPGTTFVSINHAIPTPVISQVTWPDGLVVQPEVRHMGNGLITLKFAEPTPRGVTLVILG